MGSVGAGKRAEGEATERRERQQKKQQEEKPDTKENRQTVYQKSEAETYFYVSLVAFL